MKALIIFLFLLVIPLSLAVNIEYDLQDNNVFVSMTIDDFGYFHIELPSDFKNLELNTPDYFLDENYLIINVNGNVSVLFSSQSYLEKIGKNKMFISKERNYLNSDVQIILPEGNSLLEDKVIFPNNYEFSTDGKRIIVEWNQMAEKEILLSYSSNDDNNFLYYILVLILIGFFILYYQYSQRSKNSKTKNLFREEKKIINYLINKKECWTKELVKDLDISKVKLSRKLRTLEEKGLITRIPHGNENRIKLK